MPSFDAPDLASVSKVLLVGNSKSGKTGGLISLILAGYNLRILDFDNNIRILLNLVRNAVAEGKLTVEEARQRLRFVTLADKYKNLNGMAKPDGTPTAWPKGLQLLTKWKEPDGFELPKIEEWTPQDVLCIDTLWSAGKAAMNYQTGINGRGGQKPWDTDYGEAQRQIDAMLQMLKANTSCNVLVLSHITMRENKIGGKGRDGADATPVVVFDDPQGFPALGVGKALLPDIPKYFDTMLMVETEGSGPSAKRVIHTVSKGLIELGNANPKKIPAKLPLETGLAEIFKLARGE